MTYSTISCCGHVLIFLLALIQPYNAQETESQSIAQSLYQSSSIHDQQRNYQDDGLNKYQQHDTVVFENISSLLRPYQSMTQQQAEQDNTSLLPSRVPQNSMQEFKSDSVGYQTPNHQESHVQQKSPNKNLVSDEADEDKVQLNLPSSGFGLNLGEKQLMLNVGGLQNKLELPEFQSKRDEMLYWAEKAGNQRIFGTHLAEIAACVLVKDEHLDILEWLQYHKYLGVGKFYIYDNNSVPPMIDILRLYLSQGLIDYQYINDTFLADDFLITRKRKEYEATRRFRTTSEMINSVQVWAMTSCVKNYGDRHKWMMFIDVDEFLVFQNKDPNIDPPNLSKFLADYEETGGLAVYRKTFGSSGNIARPSEGVLASYTQCTGSMSRDYRQKFPKVILNTRFFKQGGECRVHECSVSRKMVNTLFEPQTLRWFHPNGYATWQHLALHHYAVKSLEDFKLKQHRGMPHSRSREKSGHLQRTMSFFYGVDNLTDAECTQAVSYAQVCCQRAILRSNILYDKLIKERKSAFSDYLQSATPRHARTKCTLSGDQLSMVCS